GSLSGQRDRRLAVAVVHFGAGAFLSISILNLLPEAAEQAGWPPALLAATTGCLLCLALARWSGSFCPACAMGEGHAGHLSVGAPLLTVVAIHCGLDGVPLAGSAARGMADAVSLAILIH